MDMKLTKEEKKIIEDKRKKEKDTKEEADWITQYDNCYEPRNGDRF